VCDGRHGEIVDCVSPHSRRVTRFRRPRDQDSVNGRGAVATGHCNNKT